MVSLDNSRYYNVIFTAGLARLRITAEITFSLQRWVMVGELMGVKRSKSGSRMLTVLEEVARNQPVALAELARLMEGDKSGIQRSLMTLADAGWIAFAPGGANRWQLTSHIQVVAKYARDNDDLRATARPVMEKLRDACGETVLLAVMDAQCFVIIDVVESKHMVRTAPRVGQAIISQTSATAQITLPYLSTAEQELFLGRALEKAELELFEAARQRGFALNVHSHSHMLQGTEAIGSANIAAPVFDHNGKPVAALVVSGPSERLVSERQEQFGLLVIGAAREISSGVPST